MFVSRGDCVWSPGFCSFVTFSLSPDRRIPPPEKATQERNRAAEVSTPSVSEADSSLREGAKGTRLEENSVSLPHEGGGGDSRRRE